METTFSIKIEKKDSYSLCRVFGSVESTSYKSFQESLIEVLKDRNENKTYFVIDFSEVTMFSSTCINVIISVNEILEENQWKLVIISPREDIIDLLDAIGFNHLYQIFSTLESFCDDKNICI